MINKEELLLQQNITITAKEYIVLKELEEKKGEEFNEWVMLKEVLVEIMQERGDNNNLGLVEVKGAIRTPNFLIKRMPVMPETRPIMDFDLNEQGGRTLNTSLGTITIDNIPFPKIIITNLKTEKVIEI